MGSEEEKGSETNRAQHSKGRCGYWFLTPLPQETLSVPRML